AGRERLGPSGWFQVSADAQPPPSVAAGADPQPAAPSSENGSAPGPAAAAGGPSMGGATVGAGGAGVPAQATSVAAAADVHDAGAATGAASDAHGATASAPPELDDDEEHLGRLVPDASAVIGEDEAEEGGAAHKPATAKSE